MSVHARIPRQAANDGGLRPRAAGIAEHAVWEHARARLNRTVLGSARLRWDRPGMETLEIQRVRGMNDALPPDDSRLRGLTALLREHFQHFGYRGIDTPIVENLDLFLRKSGEEIAARMYTFTHWNRKLCLRPELTASVIRPYVNQMQDRPLPVRVHYAGPTFRYEKPQRGRYRQ